MGGPRLEARFAGMGAGWRTPPFVPSILRENGYEPDLYVCNQHARLSVMTVDSNRHWRPVVVADMNHLPFVDSSFRCGFFDPPYDVPYKRGVNELLRVCLERAAVLHVRDVAPSYAGLKSSFRTYGWKRDASILLLCGNDSRVRCLNLFRRPAVRSAPARR